MGTYDRWDLPGQYVEREPHVHDWRMSTHWDSCHGFGTSYSCACGATATTASERDVRSDEYAAMHMDPEGCERCRALAEGAEPLHRETVMEGDVPLVKQDREP